MKRILPVIILIVCASCTDSSLFDTSKSTKEQIQLVNSHGKYSKISSSGSATLFVKKGAAHSLTLGGNPNHFKYLLFSVKDGVLYCGTKNKTPANLDVSVHITLPNIASISISGASDIEMESFGQLQELQIAISGAGSFVSTGFPFQVQQLDVSISGAGDVKAENLISKNVSISVSGAGSGLVHATQTLDAEVSGVGSVEYIGDPKVKKQVSGVGTIAKK